jgi:DNA-binding NarL/FixJ family response regulator
MHCNTKYLQQAITSGADGYLLKDDAERELFSAIERVRNNGKYVSPCMVDDLINDWANLRSRGAQDAPNPEILTLREKEVLKLIAEGRSSREIADMLFLSVRTIDRHRENIADKLRIRKAADLVKYAVHNGYV